MDLDGSLADAEITRDHLVCLALSHEVEHFVFARAQGRKSLADSVRTIGALSTVGFSFVLAIVLGVWAGWLLDKWLGTSPWMFFLFFILGLAAGVLNVYRTAGKFLK